MDDLALRIEHVSKEYRLGAIGGGTLKGDLQSFIARRKGKEDPNSIIGSDAAYHKNEKFNALTDVSFEVKKGEVIGIIGHNGAGKSTLLKLLSRVTAPTEGKICINGRITSMLEVGTGFHGELTGRENIYMNGAILGMTNKEIDEKIEDIIEFSECRKFIDTPVKRYSSGMYVKLAFSVASHLDSEIMIMDEVLAVGDMAFQKKCLEKMKLTSIQEGKTILYVSHNMNTIRRLCERCIVLDHGTLIYDGDVNKAIDLYMGVNDKSFGVDIDLSNKRMDHLPKKIRGKFQHITLENKDEPIYEYGELIKFKLDIHAYDNLENMSLRIEFRTLEDKPVGAATVANFTNMSSNTDKLFELEMNLKGLVNGSYYVCLVLCEVNDLGTYIDVDAIYPAFMFEIIDSENKIGFNWVHSNWGYTNFNDVKIINN